MLGSQDLLLAGAQGMRNGMNLGIPLNEIIGDGLIPSFPEHQQDWFCSSGHHVTL